MKWSPQQVEALEAFRRFRDTPGCGRPYNVFYLAGYAGTGKTTLAKELAKGVEGGVLYGAFTGKAAHVMRTSGCAGATTIHRLIYHPKVRSRSQLVELEQELEALTAQGVGQRAGTIQATVDVKQAAALREAIEAEKELLGQPGFVLNENSDIRGAGLVVIDECSMVNDMVGRDLLSFGTPILVLGDPAQLPPVRGTGFFTERKPDVMLTEIHRQALDNPIIELATRVREGETLEPGFYGESRVDDICDVDDDELIALSLSCDQILVGTNKMRRGMNMRLRGLLDRNESDLPVPGEKIVCLRNDHQVGLLNGEMWYVAEVHDYSDAFIDVAVCRTEAEVTNPTTPWTDLKISTDAFLGYKPAKFGRKGIQSFDFGYALTVHKAQGSQWNHVMVLDQSRKFGDNRTNHLYTAITRAAERVQIFTL